MKSMQLMILTLSLFLTACTSGLAEAGKETAAALKEAGIEIGKEVANEVRQQGVLMSSEIIAQALQQFTLTGGNIKEALNNVISTIPGIAKNAGETVAANVIAERMEASQGKEKADKFKEDVESVGLWEALKIAGGGTTAGVILLLANLLRRSRKVQQDLTDSLTVVASAIESTPEGRRIKEKITEISGTHGATLKKTISSIKERISV